MGHPLRDSLASSAFARVRRLLPDFLFEPFSYRRDGSYNGDSPTILNAPEPATRCSIDIAVRFPRDLQILVVDDNPNHLLAVCELLSRWEISPTLAADGAEAVSLEHKIGFDLILMDMQMPVLDGLAATKQIRSHEAMQSGARTPIVAYTSGMHSSVELMKQCGVDGVLDKPCNAVDLEQCLARWCQR